MSETNPGSPVTPPDDEIEEWRRDALATVRFLRDLDENDLLQEARQRGITWNIVPYETMKGPPLEQVIDKLVKDSSAGHKNAENILQLTRRFFGEKGERK